MKKITLIALAAVIVLVAGPAMAGDTATVAVSATVTGTCKFLTNGSVSFTLDPSSSSDATGTVVQPTFWCTNGSSYTISDDNGLNESGTTFRMKDGSATPNYIAYNFTYTATGTGSGRGTTKTMNISSTVTNANFINAPAGNYNDTVTLTIAP